MSAVRLPLQIGTTSLWSLARAAGALVPSLIVLAAGGLSLAGYGGGWVTYLLTGLVMLAYTSVHAIRAWRTRPSDAVLDQAGLRLEGGSQSGLQLAWTDIDPEQTRAETSREAHWTARGMLSLIFALWLLNKAEVHEADRVPVRRLQLVARDGRTWDLAEADRPAEAESVDALLGSIHAKLLPSSPRAAPTHHEVIECPRCGAPVPPADTEAVECRYCSSSTAMPAAVRERLSAHRAMATSRVRVTQLVDRLLRQPTARWTSAVLWAAAVACLVSWAGVLVGLWIRGPTRVGIFEVSWAMSAGLCATVAVFIVARAALANRRALHLLASGFGARPPRDPSEAYSCRRCAGPLPATESLVVQCVYCDADNLLGTDLRHEVEPTEAHQWNLEQVLRSRRKERLGWLLGSLGALALVALSGLMAMTAVEEARQFEAVRLECQGGSASACYSLAVDYERGNSVTENLDLAFEAYQRSCELGHGEACSEVGDWYYTGRGEVFEDEEQAEAYRIRACKLGFEEACQRRY